MRTLALLLLLIAPLPALANGPDCGGDAYSSATVGPNPPGPLTAVPDTLCADLEPGPAAGTRIEVIAPGLAPDPYGDRPPPYGDRYAPAPYGGRPPLGPRPPYGRGPER
ncbi:hypothetical protein NS228_04750 [Methylobacterium indicum]|uniref:Uncharacterized protein n=1 Tax=Methylobacterium indicum TaxID=1775910 RepID=A0A8H8WQN5_9HYPH|nr:hypothetical protein [Methylobacterium indicum]KTS25286.1 hypothetical protein NS229_19870 [Methylobacterium indicum]KTS41852.1 hypothetical protein NS228_04750 [Methylobacterium indicum]KTS49797.1 hypothetical protein NS230_17090 [Methylobacterium indicum]BCM82545.1 hypothetical protein mvi_10060 [Methylobacterium indicum]